MIKKKNIYFFISLVIYNFLLAYSYVNYLSPLFSYTGLTTDINYKKMFLSILCQILLLSFLKFQYKPSNILLYLLFVNSLIPCFTLFYLQNLAMSYFYILCFSYSLLFLLVRIIPSIKIKTLNFKTLSENKLINFLLLITILLAVYRILNLGGLDIRAFSLTDLYELRNETKVSGIWGYLHHWLTKVFIPVLMLYYLFNKKYVLFFIVMTLQFFLFASTGQKTLLFSIFLIIICYFLLQLKFWYVGLPILYSLLVLFSMLLYNIYNNIIGIGIFIDRQLFLPAYIGNKYINFFSSGNPKLNFSEGLLGKLFNIDKVYGMDIANIISGSPNIYENTGFIFDAFSNGGVIGIVFIIVLLSFIIKSIDTLSSSNNILFASFMIYPIIILNDGSLLSVLLTHGVLILFIIIYLISSVKKDRSFK